MAKPKWQQKIQDRLDNNPLYMIDNNIVCHNCKGARAGGKKLTLRQVVNYSWNTCCGCKRNYCYGGFV